jgi:hypothetical protein
MYNNIGGTGCCEGAVQMYQSDLNEEDPCRVTYVKGRDGKLLPALPSLPEGTDPSGYVLTIDINGHPAWLPNLGSTDGVASITGRLEAVEENDSHQDETIDGMQTAIGQLGMRIDDIAGSGGAGGGGELGLDGRYLRKDQEDATGHKVKFRDGLETGYYTGELITDTGGKIDSQANAILTSLKLREFLEVPEFRFNKIDVISGETWNTVAYGIISEVDRDSLTFTVKLEDGEIHGLQVKDLCRGIWHNTDTSQNWDGIGSTADEVGFEKTQGFATSYFKVTGLSGQNQVLYELKPGSDQHPAKGMKFAVFGHTDDTKPERQCSVYSTRTYIRYLRGVNSWQITSGNITAQFGDLSGLHIDDGTPGGIRGTPGSIYLNNIYFGGSINNVNGLMSALNEISPYTAEGIPEEIYRNADSDASHFDVNGNYKTRSLSFVITVRKGTHRLTYSPSAEAGKYSVSASAGGGATFDIKPEGTEDARVEAVTWTSADAEVTVTINCEGQTSLTRKLKLGMLFNGTDGKSAYRLDLTNETDTVSCDISGEPIAGTDLPSTTAHLYLGQEEITDTSFIWSSSGCTITGTGNTRRLATITSDSATVTVSHAGSGLSSIMTVKKIRNGAEPVRWTLLPSASEIKKKNDGTCIPSEIECEAYRTVGGGDPALTSEGKKQYRTSDDTSWTDYTGVVTVINTWDWIEFRLTDENETTTYDRERVLVLEDGDTPYFLALTDENTTIPCDASGNPLSGITMPSTTAHLYLGQEEITDTSYIWSTSGCTITGTGNTRQLASITSESATVTVSHSGSGQTKIWTITKNRGISGAIPVSWKVQPSTTVIRISKNGTITPASVSCAKMRAEGASDYTATAEGFLQYSINGTAWNTYSNPLTVQASWTMLHFRLLNTQGGSTVYDSQQVAVLNEGTDGKAPLRIYRVSASQPSRPADNTAAPAGWSFTPVAASYPNVLWMSEALFYADGTLVNTVNTWSEPVQISGDKGQDGDGLPGPSMIFTGEYSSSETYQGSNEIIMMVKQGALYYMTMPSSGTFSNISPSTDVASGDGTTGSRWQKFSGNFKSVATGLLLAESALIAGWMFKNGVLQSQNELVILDGRPVPNTSQDPSDPAPRIALGASYANRRSAAFRVYENGTLYASDAHLSGEVNATSGSIGGFSIYDDPVSGAKALKGAATGDVPAYIEMISNKTQIRIGGILRASGQVYDQISGNNVTLIQIKSDRVQETPPTAVDGNWLANIVFRIDAKSETVETRNQENSLLGEFIPATQGICAHMVGGLRVQGHCLFAKLAIRFSKNSGTAEIVAMDPEYFMITDTFIFQMNSQELILRLPLASEVMGAIDKSSGYNSGISFGGAVEYTIINKGTRDYNDLNAIDALDRTLNGSNRRMRVYATGVNINGNQDSTNCIYKGGEKLTHNISNHTAGSIEVLPGEVLKLMCTQRSWYVSGGYGSFATSTINSSDLS